MAGQPTSREALYERIRSTSKEEVILEEMIRLGFWPAQGTVPHDPAEEIRRRGELERQLAELREKSRKLYNEKVLIAEQRKARLAESRRKQKETKARRERERQERAQKWAARKAGEILHLGEDVSGGMSHKTSDPELLKGEGLPVLASAEELAKAMGLEVNALRFLAYNRKVSRVSHYHRFLLPKKTGGFRLISAPMPRLKRAQTWALEHIFAKLRVDSAAHGFVAGRSIVSNAKPHVGADVVVNFDLKDFFPTVTFPRVKGAIRRLGYSESLATALALVCTEPDLEEVALDGVTWFVARGPRHLPQGSPCSPAITNLLCRRLDRRLGGLAQALGFVYTRYADDLTFSGRGEAAESKRVGKLLRGVADIVAHEGFVVHPEKTRVMRRGRRQEVTGIVVNDRPSVPRDELRKFRATLFQIEKDGPAGKRWGNGGDVLAAVHGYACFVAMVDPARGQPLLARARALLAKHGGPSKSPGGSVPRVPSPNPQSVNAPEAPKPAAPASPAAPAKKGWKLF
ncbi:Reverse transcriptase (RNA-dependent DNA polymerase) [Nannocystis exedens]|uniref:RNA-directed DNA polymerase n=1 Tax=Nannocystis exedens TaxID=54 RepID=A0A1I1VMG1_9BACT|nr:reverse transcriptase family protein [Nannocystis exedens]PCC72657.1 RNA-directed DNA polymerase [Nannocystis exedens]SFD84004.1 Reverse transcriptase (RNA-dependent DNA polymerase) [Nannocystis exedens]